MIIIDFESQRHGKLSSITRTTNCDINFTNNKLISTVGPPNMLYQGTKNGVEQMVSKAHHSASRHITMHQLCFALQSLFFQKRHAYTCIYIFGPAGPECGPANHRQEENRGSASWRISGASRRITIHPRYHLFYIFFVSSIIFSYILIETTV